MLFKISMLSTTICKKTTKNMQIQQNNKFLKVRLNGFQQLKTWF